MWALLCTDQHGNNTQLPKKLKVAKCPIIREALQFSNCVLKGLWLLNNYRSTDPEEQKICNSPNTGQVWTIYSFLGNSSPGEVKPLFFFRTFFSPLQYLSLCTVLMMTQCRHIGILSQLQLQMTEIKRVSRLLENNLQQPYSNHRSGCTHKHTAASPTSSEEKGKKNKETYN